MGVALSGTKAIGQDVVLNRGRDAAERRHEDPSAEPRTMPLWEGAAPGALGNAEEDRPTLTIYEPFNAQEPTAAVIVIPGGSYEWLATNHEGRQLTNWLNAMGITAFLLRYRVGPKYHHPVELGDAQRAIRMVRARAREFRALPDKIGVLGFSAGGHLASPADTHFDAGNEKSMDPIDRVSSRPDFAVLCYPVISLAADYTHPRSRENLLGKDANLELRQNLSNETQVTKETPPTFLWSTSTDTGVPPENSVAFYLALHNAGVPAELHIFAHGPHGAGLYLQDSVGGRVGGTVEELVERERGFEIKLIGLRACEEQSTASVAMCRLTRCAHFMQARGARG